MKNKVIIVMYHYVRDLKKTNYPKINGLSIDLFKEQIQYIKKNYNVIRMQDLILTIENETTLKEKSVLLTFDDAYIDHFNNVFPILDDYNIQGSFFPPAKAITENKVLDVNKIHFILASIKNKDELIKEIYGHLKKYREKYNLKENNYYFKKFAIANRFDDKNTIFIKRILQRGIPEKLRNIIVDNLFKKYVCEDETMFSKELYMNVNHMKQMRKKGMYIGSHGYEHYWLNTLSRTKIEKEIDLSLEFLKKIGSDTNNWVMCYPYGAYSNKLISIIKKRNCKLGLTTNVGIANLEKDDRFILPRLDTNDLPKDRNSKKIIE